MRLCRAALFLFLATDSFEVASVKPQPWTGQGSVGIFIHGNTLDAQHVSLNDLVQYAWNLRDLQLSGGPAWAQRGKLVSSDLFQVIAKAPGDTPPSAADFRVMLQALLVERFQLRVRHATKELPVYNLVIAKSGAKLKESDTDAKFALSIDSGKLTRITARHVSIEQVIEHIERAADRPLFDKTGLTAFYDFELEYAKDDAEPVGPSLFTALQNQLGLKLEAATAPFDMVVIDHAEKPSAN